MVQENGSRLATVQEEEDEIVIQAGCLSSGFSDRSASANESGDPVGAACGNDGDQDRTDHPRPVRPPDALGACDRMVTTEEDLREQVPFSGMRRIILALAAIAILAMLAYCWFL